MLSEKAGLSFQSDLRNTELVSGLELLHSTAT